MTAVIYAISTCTSCAELRGLLDGYRARGLVLTDSQTRAAQIKKAELKRAKLTRPRR